MASLENLFEQYDELAEDVARSTTDFFSGNLQRWIDFLMAADAFARPIAQTLEPSADFNAWFEPYRVAMGQGGKPIEWPKEQYKRLGLQLMLLRRFADGTIDPRIFSFTIMRTGRNIQDGISAIIRQIFIPAQRELRRYLRQVNDTPRTKPTDPGKTMQVVDEIKKYADELDLIKSRFKRTSDGLHMSTED